MSFFEPGLHDRGLAYGDGVFETLRLEAGQLMFWPEHLARLSFGCRALGLPEPDALALHDAMNAAVLNSGRMDAAVKLIYTAGAGMRGYQRAQSPTPSLAVLLSDLPETPRAWDNKGMVVGVLPMQSAGSLPTLTGLKHLNRLPQVLARAAWPAEVDECLVCDAQGQLLGGTQSNLCWLEGNQWFTPPIAGTAIAGTVRGLLIRHFGVKVAPLAWGRLALAGAMVLTNAVRGVRPVGRVLWPKAALAPNAGQALVLAPAQTLAVGWQALSQAYLNAATDNAAIMPAALMQTAWVSSLSQEGFLAMPMQNQ
jgi:4-amino-4-deoxychorismate lyase